MHILKSILFSFLLIISCRSGGKEAAENDHAKFDKIKWAETYDAEYSYREEMLDDLINNHLVHGLKQASIKALLGEPDRTDNGHLFYKISQKKLGLFPLATKTLVIKLTKDSTLEWRKLHG